jgi:hypothetical protein
MDGKVTSPTPSREELLARDLLIEQHNGDHWLIDGYQRNADPLWTKTVEFFRRLAAKPADEVREATIEECAKILDDCAQGWNRIRDPGLANNARAYARQIRALSTKG